MRVSERPLSGFSLIELMIAVAVIGILAMVAIPQYQSYSVRAKVSECLTLASSTKIAVSESHFSGRGIDYSFSQTGFCENIQIADDGSIVMNTRNTGANVSPVLQLVPSISGAGGSNLNWECQLVSGRPDHVPTVCRGEGTLASIGNALESGVAIGDAGQTTGGSGGSSGAGSGAGSTDSGSGNSNNGSSGSSSGSGTSSGGGDTGSSPDSGSGASGGGTGSGAPGGGGDSGGNSSGSGSSGGSASGGDSSGGNSSGGGGSGSGSSGGSSSGGGGSSGGSSGGGGSGGGSSGGGSSGGGSSGGGDSGGNMGGKDGDADDDEEEECPYRLPNGRPHPGKCRGY